MSNQDENAARSGTVFIVDDDALMRTVLARIIGKAGWTARPCVSGDAFLHEFEEVHPSCVVLDLSMPGKDGVEIQKELIRRSIAIPVVFLTGAGTISIATRALLRGAVDFLVKPVDPAVLVLRIELAMREDLHRIERLGTRRRFDSLTERELEVCERLYRGLASKQIARDLSISVRTVEHHRERLLAKTGATNTAELVSLYARARASIPHSEQ